MRLREARESAPGKRRGVELDQEVAQRTQELAATVDSIPGLIGVLSADGQVVEFVNRQLLEFCGRTLEDFRSTDVVHPDDLENSTLAGRHGFETGQSYSVDHRLRRADGAYRWFHAVGQPLRDASGHVIRWHLLLTDIHERKIAEEKLAQQTEELAALVDSIPGMVGVLTVEGEVEFVNRPLREYAGKTLEEFKDWTTNDTVHPDDLANTIAAWRRAVETGQPHTYDHRVHRADGAYRWFHAESMPLRDADGRIIRWYILMTDIHERKRAEQDLALQNTRLELLLKLINQITSNLELREVLRAVAASVRDLMHADAAGVAFYDEASDKCRIYAVDFPEAKGFVAEEIVVTPGLAIRRAWENSKPVLLNKSVPAELGLETYRLVVAEGLNGHCLIPLMSRGRPVAILIVASKAGDSFLPQDVEFLSRASGQIAIAIERKIAEEKLREDERELRRITEAIPHAIHVFGADGTLLHVNQTALDCSGLTLEDARREDYPFRIVHPDDVRRIYEWRQNLIRPDPFEYEVRLLGKDGKYRWFLIHNNPVLDEQGHIIRWYATGTDIENRKRAEEQVQNENLALREEISRSSMFEEIVGSSQPISRVLEQVVRVAPTDSTVLISGETGTGKELIARAIHKRSNRSGRAFISVNCGAIARSLIASELFGHEKGAFTGAVQRRIGRFEAAQGGTIFLDEVGELPAEAQVSLLRVLQEREFERIGSHEVLKVDVRVLAATNRDLEQAVSAGSFRSDLFYRLNVFPIEVPPLRDRASDILLLAEYMIGRYAKNAGKRFTSIGSSTLELLSNYPWPGNIRELQNVIERAVVLCDGPVFSVDETWLKLAPNRAHAPAVPVSIASVDGEKEMIEKVLAQSRGRVSGASGAAAKLGVARSTLESRILRLGINKHQFRTRE